MTKNYCFGNDSSNLKNPPIDSNNTHSLLYNIDIIIDSATQNSSLRKNIETFVNHFPNVKNGKHNFIFKI